MHSCTVPNRKKLQSFKEDSYHPRSQTLTLYAPHRIWLTSDYLSTSTLHNPVSVALAKQTGNVLHTELVAHSSSACNMREVFTTLLCILLKPIAPPPLASSCQFQGCNQIPRKKLDLQVLIFMSNNLQLSPVVAHS